jgi:hypothetical protein
MGIEITHHDVPLEDFNQLINTYPRGRYDDNNGSYWFSVVIREMKIELTWFRTPDWK